MRILIGLIAGVMVLGLADQASALTIVQPVTAGWVKDNPKEFSIQAELREDGLLHYAITRHVTGSKYLVAHFKVRLEDGTAVESHSPSFVKEAATKYYVVISPQRLSQATFELSEHGVSEISDTPIPVVGGIIYQIRLSDFAPELPKPPQP